MYTLQKVICVLIFGAFAFNDIGKIYSEKEKDIVPKAENLSINEEIDSIQNLTTASKKFSSQIK